MKQNNLKNTDLQIPPIILGGNVFGWTLNERESFNILDAAMEHGFNFIDTANSYSHWVPGNKGGESEAIIGKWLKQKGARDKICIATKIGSAMGKGKPNLSKKAIIDGAHQSLRRLNTDYIDLYQSHHDDLDTPIEETMEAYAELIKAGKVRYIGASNFSSTRLQQAQAIAKDQGFPSYQSIQPEYNLYDRANYEKNLAPYVEESGISVIPYYSLASGFLTGKYRSADDFNKSKRGTGIEKYLNNRGFEILKALDQLSKKYQKNIATISLVWLCAQPTVTAPISSVTNLKQLADLTQVAKLNLTPADIQLLNQASHWK